MFRLPFGKSKTVVMASRFPAIIRRPAASVAVQQQPETVHSESKAEIKVSPEMAVAQSAA